MANFLVLSKYTVYMNCNTEKIITCRIAHQSYRNSCEEFARSDVPSADVVFLASVDDNESVRRRRESERHHRTLQDVDAQDVKRLQCITAPQSHMRVNVVCSPRHVTGTTLSSGDCYFVGMNSHAERYLQ